MKKLQITLELSMNMWQEYLLKLINMKKQEHMEPIQGLRKWKAQKKCLARYN